MESNLNNLGFKYTTITAKMSQEERTKRLEEFNDPNSDTMILLMTNGLGATSVNLQNCRHIICVEIPISFYVLCQILGRVNRIGQTGEQTLQLLFLYNSFDQYALSRMYTKMVPILAGEGNCLTDDDPVVDAENKLMLALGVKYSMLDKASWATPPWTNCQDHIKFADKMREVSGRWLYTSDFDITRMASQAVAYNKTPEKDARTVEMIGNRRKRAAEIGLQNLPKRMSSSYYVCFA